MRNVIRLVKDCGNFPISSGHDYYSAYLNGEKLHLSQKLDYNSLLGIKTAVVRAYPDALIKTGIIFYKQRITRSDLRSTPIAEFVFGDNVARVGFGGQSGEMRGEPNAIGIPTMRSPGTLEREYFSDSNENDRNAMTGSLTSIISALDDCRVIYVPSKGLGTGHSELRTRAPRLYAELFYFFNRMSDRTCPWERPTQQVR